MADDKSFSSELHVRLHEAGDKSWVLIPEGSLDSSTAEGFGKKAQELFSKDTRHLLLDMFGVQYLSSQGLGEILKLLKRTKEMNWGFGLYDCQLKIRRVLEISRLDFLEVKSEKLEDSHPFKDYIQALEPEREKVRKSRQEAKKWISGRSL